MPTSSTKTEAANDTEIMIVTKMIETLHLGSILNPTSSQAILDLLHAGVTSDQLVAIISIISSMKEH